MAETKPAATSSAAKLVTWLGEDDLHFTLQENEHGEIERNAAAGPSFMFWARVRFNKDKPVLIDPAQAPNPEIRQVYEQILAKAPKQPKSFKVEDVVEEVTEEGEEPHEPKHAPPRIQPPAPTATRKRVR